MSVIRVSANRSVIQVQRGVLGNLGGLSGRTIGNLSPFRVVSARNASSTLPSPTWKKT